MVPSLASSSVSLPFPLPLILFPFPSASPSLFPCGRSPLSCLASCSRFNSVVAAFKLLSSHVNFIYASPPSIRPFPLPSPAFIHCHPFTHPSCHSQSHPLPLSPFPGLSFLAPLFSRLFPHHPHHLNPPFLHHPFPSPRPSVPRPIIPSQSLIYFIFPIIFHFS